MKAIVCESVDCRCFAGSGLVFERRGDRAYNLSVLEGLHDNEAIVPFLWLYEVLNGLVMANRRKRVSMEEFEEIMTSIRALPITVDPPNASNVLELPPLALKHQLTVYDTAYLELAIRCRLPIATRDNALMRAMTSCGIKTVQP
jgi:predicted nucleic acid-binding protein